jgi:hypothetical protein
VKFDHGASFLNAVFGHGAFFKDAAFGHRASFDSAAFGNRANFDGAAFGDEASFNGATFGDWATIARMNIEAWFAVWKSYIPWSPVGEFFTGIAFGLRATFIGATFGYRTSFSSATFHSPTDFGGATFGDKGTFAIATFGEQASFDGAAFGDRASFKGTVFKGPVTFTGKSNEESIRRLEVVHGIREASGVARAGRHDALWRGLGSGPNCFIAISFERARFDDKADFSGRTFDGDADFTNARFYCPPNFDVETKLARIDFTGAYIGFGRRGRPNWTLQSRVAIQLRALRNIAEDTKNHDLERDLYIEERKAERGIYLVQRFLDWLRDPKRKWALIAHLLWILVMGAYWALADYGRSFARPFV